MNRIGRAGLTLVALATVGLATACTKQVENEDVALTVSGALQEQGISADDLDCPQDLTAAVGETVRCTFSTNGQQVDAVATVRHVDGKSAQYDVVTVARPVDEVMLEQRIGDDVSKRVGQPVDGVDCSGDLPAVVGGAVWCSVNEYRFSPIAQRYIHVVVTSVNRGELTYEAREL